MTENIPIYQKLTPKIRELKALRMTLNEISDRLKINKNTIKKILAYKLI